MYVMTEYRIGKLVEKHDDLLKILRTLGSYQEYTDAPDGEVKALRKSLLKAISRMDEILRNQP